MTDREVTITREQSPPEVVTSGHIRKPPVLPAHKTERLSGQAEEHLRRAGYSRRFISMVAIMLTDASNTNRYPFSRQSGDSTGSGSPGFTEPLDLPRRLSGHTNESPEGSTRVLMPDIGSYAPSTTYTPEVYRAFASREGQRFMRREYNWLEQDSRTGEWNIVPSRVLEATPRRAAP